MGRAASGALCVTAITLALAFAACSAFSGNESTAAPEADGGAGDDGSRPVSTADASVGDATPHDASDASEAATKDAVADACSEDAGALAHANAAIEFDTNNYVGATFVPIPQNFTLEAWVKMNALSGESVIFAEDQSGDATQEFRLGVDANGHVYFAMSDSTGTTHGLRASSTYAFLSNTALGTTNWHHVAVTKSGKTFTYVIDGVLDLTMDFTDFTRNGPMSQLRIASRIASDGTSTQDELGGDIDEVRLWNVARTVDQIAAGRTHGFGPCDPEWSNIVTYFRFDDDALTKAVNATDPSNPGTLVGAPAWIAAKEF
jgi:hypothetical protein